MSTSETSARSILTALHDRLNAARQSIPGSTTSYVYPLDAWTLPTNVPGNPDRILNLLTQTTQTTVAVTSANGPTLNDAGDTLSLAGSATLLGAMNASINITLTVATNLELEVVLRLDLPQIWTLADAFPVLTNSAYDYLPLQQPLFIITSYQHTDSAIFYQLQVGLQFQAALSVQSNLMPVTQTSGQAGLQTILFGGTIDVASDGRPQFAFAGGDTFTPLTIIRTGQSPLTLQNGMLSLHSTRTTDVNANQNDLAIAGSVAVSNNNTLQATLTLPTIISPLLTLTTTTPTVGEALVSDIFTQVGIADNLLQSSLPQQLLTQTRAVMSNLTLQFDPVGNEATVTTISITFPGPFFLVRSLNLTLSQITLQANVSRYSGYIQGVSSTYSVQVSGTITLGSQGTYLVQANIPLSGPWDIEITDTSHVPLLENLASLIGLDALRVLPASLQPLCSATLANVFLSIDPFNQTIKEISFTIKQTDAWQIVGTMLTVSHWVIDMTLAHPDGTWQASGVLEGNIILAAAGNTTTLAIHMPIPIAEGSWWTIALAEDTVVQIPSIGQILALFGNSTLTLPQHIADLGALDVTLFILSFDPATLELKRLAFACQQASNWTITDQITITKVAGSFSFLPQSSSVQTYGYATGRVTVAGTALDMVLLKNTYEGDWLLEAGYNEPIHIPGFSSLNTWLNPQSAQSYLPRTLPLNHGLDFAQLLLTFDGTTGTLKSIAFTLKATDAWIILPKLSLTQVQASLTYPLQADQVTGYITGLITLDNVMLLLTANKPSTNVPWSFHGSLAENVTIDLLAVINEIAQQADFALPGDITSYDFPHSVTIESANVLAIPGKGTFHFDGSAGFDWQFSLGLATVWLRSIRATIDVAEKNGPLAATIQGTFDFASIRTTLTLSLGTQTTETILIATIATADVSQIQIPQVTDQISANSDTEKWAQLVPTDLSSLNFRSAALYMNLTSKHFLLYGELRYGTTPAVANALVFCEQKEQQATTNVWNYLFALSIADGFRFGQLFSALAVIDDYLHVNNAHLVIGNIADSTLGTLSQEVMTLLGTVAPLTSSPLAGLTNETLALQRGVFFVADLNFTTQTIFSNILQIGNTETPLHVRLSALISHTDSTQSVFSANLPDITLLNTIRLTRTGTYTGIHLSYTPAKQNEFQLAGQVQLSSLFGRSLNFDVLLTVNQTRLTSNILQTPQELVNPFGLPGITLSNLALSLQYTFAQPSAQMSASSQFTLVGHVLFGPAPQAGSPDTRLSFIGKLALVNSTPALVYIAIDRDFSIGRFLAQCITGNGSSWPSDFIDITFLNGTRISYYSKTNDPSDILANFDGYSFRDGFTIDAQLQLTLVTQLSLHVIVQVLRNSTTNTYQGIKTTLVLDAALNLVFLELAGITLSQQTTENPNSKYQGGPELSIETGSKRSFGVKTGINFLSSPFLVVDVAISKNAAGNTQFDGHLEAKEALEPFNKLVCDFTYIIRPGQSNQLTINNWPDFTWVRNIIDFVQEIKKLCDTRDASLCGQLSGMVADQAYSTTFALHPSVYSEENNLVFAFTGSYALKIAGTNDPFLTMQLPPFSVGVPDTTTYEKLPDALAQGISAASSQFVHDLVHSPKDMAMFLAMLFGNKAIAISLELACNGLIDGTTAGATEAAADAITAVGGAVAAVGQIGVIAAAIKNVIDQQQGGSGGDPSHPQTPVLKTLFYANAQNAVVGTWGAASYATGYTFEVLQPDGTSLGTRDFGYSRLTGSLPVNPSTLPIGTYQGRVKATRGELSSLWSTALQLQKPAKPVLQLTYRNGMLNAMWPDLHVNSYVVQVFDPQQRQVGTDQTTSMPQVSLPLPEPSIGTYSVRVRAIIAEAIPGDWSTPATFVFLGQPTTLSMSFAKDTITLHWSAVSEAMGYDVQLLDASHTPLGMPIHVTATQEQELRAPFYVPLGASTIPTGEIYGRVRATSTSANVEIGGWEISADFLTRLASITVEHNIYDNAQSVVIVSWATPVAHSLSYLLRLTDVDGSPIGQTVIVTVDALQAAIPFPIGVQPGPVHVQVLVFSADPRTIPSPWVSSPNALTHLAPMSPTLRLIYREATVTLSWQPVVGATGYEIQLLTDHDVPLGTPFLVGGEQTLSVQVPLTALTQSGLYPIRIRAISSGSTYISSDWVSSNEELRVLDLVTPTSVIYDTETLTMYCPNIPLVQLVTQYRVLLLDPMGEQAFSQLLTGASTFTSTRLTANVGGVAANVEYKLFIRPLSDRGVGLLGNAYPVKWKELPVTLGQPAVTNLSYNGTVLAAWWDNPAGAESTITLELLDSSGTPLFQQAGLSGINTILELGKSSTLPLDRLENGALYMGKVQAVSANAQSAWSTLASFQYVNLPPPPWLHLIYAQGALQADWGSSVLPFIVLGANTLVFNGTNNYVSVLGNISLRMLQTATWEVWCKPDVQTGEKKILWRELPGGIQTQWADGVISVCAYPVGSNQWQCVKAAGFAPRQWYHVAGVLDGTKLSLYINGQFHGSTPCGLLAMSPNEWHWGRWNSTGYDFKGEIAEVRIWNVARQPAEIATTLYQYLAPQKGLVGYWPLPQSMLSNDILDDLSGSGSIAVLGGGDRQAAPTVNINPLLYDVELHDASGARVPQVFMTLNTQTNFVPDHPTYLTALSFYPGAGYQACIRTRLIDYMGGWSDLVPQYERKAELIIAHEGSGRNGQLWYTSQTDQDQLVAGVGTAGDPGLAVYHGLVYCVRQGTGASGELWYTTFNGSTWSANQHIPGVGMSHSPSIVMYGNLLYCMHEGKGENGQLWYTTFDGKTWSTEQQVPNVGTTEGPGLAAYHNLLYCTHQGSNTSGELWYTTFNGRTWSADQHIPGVSMSHSPSLIVYNDLLYCMHEGSGENGQLWYTTFDGNTWSADRQVPNVGTTGGPGLAVYDGLLYCFHQSSGATGELWYTTFDGNTWSADRRILNIGVSTSPALIAYNGSLYGVHEGSGNSGQLWYVSLTATTVTWAADQQVPNVGTTDGFGLAIYQRKMYCVHQGSGENGQLWYTSFDGVKWDADRQVPNVGLSSCPGVIAYLNLLYCVHEGSRNSGQLWYTTFDGNTWSADRQVPNVSTTGGPGLAVYHGLLYCAHQGSGENGQLWYTTFNGTFWSADQLVPGVGISHSPSLIVYKGLLYCMYEGSRENGELRYTTFDGNTWSADRQVPGVSTTEGPGLVIGNDWLLYCVHQGSRASGQLWYTTFDGTFWSVDRQIPNVVVSNNLAIALL